jgi:hypothetical protein
MGTRRELDDYPETMSTDDVAQNSSDTRSRPSRSERGPESYPLTGNLAPICGGSTGRSCWPGCGRISTGDA